MAFKFGNETSIALDSPERMFQDFSDRTLKGLLTYQGRVLAEYQAEGLDQPDVAFKLPTGSGKTLVGLLIADWRRRRFGERTVYLCPTNQLVNQVVNEAHLKYGMRGCVHSFTGSQKSYDPSAKSKFQSGDLVAVTSYAALFNVRPFFDEPHLIILDDAHAAENYLIGFWTLSVQRAKEAHQALFQALAGVLQSVLSEHDAKRLTSAARSPWDYYWVEKIPAERFAEIQAEFTAIVDAHVAETDLRYPWSVIRDHLGACNLYVGSQEIAIRPLIPPTHRHWPFRQAKQRIYMSATLGEGGDLERLTGTKKIHRLGVPDDLNTHGVGRRFFVFPGRSLSDSDQAQVLRKAIHGSGKAVVLVPDFRTANKVIEEVCKPLGFEAFTADQIESSKTAFVNRSKRSP
ncbi:MAG: DEAD/DEAH box helicase family protein [Alphaproteobacteria bacterium]|nr:DEAD/DEAH box helicase family protein [Alphaproteobacteria bacterium]